jgi:hypothetical protein
LQQVEAVTVAEAIKLCGNKLPSQEPYPARNDLIIGGIATMIDEMEKAGLKVRWHWCADVSVSLKQAIAAHTRRNDKVLRVIIPK